MFFKIINRRYIRTRVVQFVYSNSILEDDFDKNILDFRNSISNSLDLLYCSIDLIKEIRDHFFSIQTTKQSFEIILDKIDSVLLGFESYASLNKSIQFLLFFDLMFSILLKIFNSFFFII